MSASAAVIEEALAHIPLGFAVFSLVRGTKTPITTNGKNDATTDPVKARTMLEAKGAGNYGIIAPNHGTTPLIMAIDLDDGDGATEPWRARYGRLALRLGDLPLTKQTQTPSGGRHAFFYWPPDVPIPPGDDALGFTIRWPGKHYCVGPGSVIAGKVYTSNGKPIIDLPRTWVDAIVAEKAPAPESMVTIFGPGYTLPEPGYTGERYAAIRDYIASRYMRGVSLEEMWVGVRDVLAPRFASPLTEAELRSRFERAWKGTPERLGTPMPEAHTSNAATRTATVSVGIDAADLLAMTLAPLRMIVPGLLPEGTSLLAAHPKTGKSCLVYQIATEVSLGGELFGQRVASGSALYLALEDGMRRGQDRLRAALRGRTLPHGRLEVRWSAPRIGEGLEADIAAWLDSHADATFVAIDTLGRVKPKGNAKANAYDTDVEYVGRLQDLFRDRHVALLLVHHLNKGRGDDFVEQVSGTYGISGSVDTIIHVARKRTEQFGTISTTGRDIADGRVSVRFDEMTWSLAPEALAEATFSRTEVYRAIEEIGPAMPKRIADHLGLERSNVQHRIERLVEDGAVARTPAGYTVTTTGPYYPPSHSSHLVSDGSDGVGTPWSEYPSSAWEAE